MSKGPSGEVVCHTLALQSASHLQLALINLTTFVRGMQRVPRLKSTLDAREETVK